MPKYKSYLISAFSTGLYTAHEPRLAPKDGFPTMYDASIEKGVVVKRNGFTEVADTGASDAIVGIYAYMRHGKPNYLVADTDRLWTYAPYGETLTDLAGEDIFTGDAKDLFWFQTWRDKCYICNGVDLPYVYDEDAETLESLDTVGDAETDIQIDSCQFIFRYKSRLIFMNCTIDGTFRPSRIYYSDVNTVHVASTNFVQGDIEDVFVSACYINGIPTVFGHEGFVAQVRYTGSAETPFSLDEMDQDDGTLGPRLLPYYTRKAIRLTHKGLVEWDGYQNREVGPTLRRWIDSIENFENRYMVATIRKDRPQLLLAYPADGSTSNDRILVYDYEDDAFSIHKISATALLATTGSVIPEVALITAKFGDPGDGTTMHDLDVVRHPTYPYAVLMGTADGKLYRYGQGTTDDGTAISAEIWTARLNEFEAAGLQCRIGDIRFLVGTSSSKTATVHLYNNQSTTAWKTTTLSADGDGDKHWVTLFGDGEVGNFHQLAITGDIPDIHAIEIEFAPAGKLDCGGVTSTVTFDSTSDPGCLWRFIQNDDEQLETQKYVDGTWTTVEVTDP